MKIPFMIIAIAILLSACNSVKSSTTNELTSTFASSEPKPVVISNQRNLRAAVYVAGESAMVRVGEQSEQILTGINPMLYQDYSSVFFRTHDLDRDGLSEVAVLASTSFGGVNLCYDVFHYHLTSGKFTRRLENFYCTGC